MSGPPASLSDRLSGLLGAGVESVAPVSGGNLNDAYRALLGDGRRVFVKCGQDEYRLEADGLCWLAAASGGPKTPSVLALAPGLLALEWIDSGPSSRSAEERLGRALALLHRAGAPAFGALPPAAPAAAGAAEPGSGARNGGGFAGKRPASPAAASGARNGGGFAGKRPASTGTLVIGPLRLPLTAAGTWPEVYGELLRHLARRAELPAVDRLLPRLPDLLGPPESPARLHGDLWAGNVLVGRDGYPYVIDPAAYGGHREVDLAMLRLFGGPGRRCFDAYAEAYPPATGHEDRVALYQLLPLLVHAVLFGGSYRDRAAAAARHYTGFAGHDAGQV